MEKIGEYRIHPAANIFEMLSATAFEEMAESIKARKLLSPIEMFDGQVIDGRNRLKACLAVGVEPRFVTIETDDPIRYVWDLNAVRRHLDTSGLALAGATMRGLYDEQALVKQKEGQKKGGTKGGRPRKKDETLVAKVPPRLPTLQPEVTKPAEKVSSTKTRDVVGKLVGVSGRYIDDATKVLKSDIPGLEEAVRSGAVKLPKAVMAIRAIEKHGHLRERLTGLMADNDLNDAIGLMLEYVPVKENTRPDFTSIEMSYAKEKLLSQIDKAFERWPVAERRFLINRISKHMESNYGSA